MNNKDIDITKFDLYDKILLETIKNRSSLYVLIEINRMTYSQIFARVDNLLEQNYLIRNEDSFVLSEDGYILYNMLNSLHRTNYKKFRSASRDDKRIERFEVSKVYIKK